MAIRDLVPWSSSRGREVSGRREEEPHPILSLHREMNRLFEDVFRGFDLSPFSMDRWNGTTRGPE
jgi:HSP20 family protein